MEHIEFYTSELLKLSRIMKLQKRQWVVLFKKWFMQLIRNHYWSNSLFLANRESETGCFKDMNIGEFTQAMFDSNYPKILADVHYNEDKLNWWNNVVDEYERSLAVYNRIRARGVMYKITHWKLVKKAAKRLNEKDVILTDVDIVEIALSRYIKEGHGDQTTFIKFMK